MQKNIPSKLAVKRKELKKKQVEIAREVGITRSYYANIERGIRNPSLKVAKKIAQVLGSTMDELF